MRSIGDVIAQAAYKTLRQVDLPRGSNQHEINGSRSLRKFFGASQPTRGTIIWKYFSDSSETIAGEEGEYNFYDAREASFEKTGRTEWRLYYTGEFLEYAKIGDTLIIVRLQSNVGDIAPIIYGLVFEQNSSWLRAATSLLGPQLESSRLRLFDEQKLTLSSLDFLSRQLLEEIGIPFGEPVTATDEDLVIQRFGLEFPSTREMSTFARELTSVDVSVPDAALVAWLDREESLFRALERRIVQDRIDLSFDSVDEFVAYSLSVHNRRKSRMGHAFENHLEELLRLRKLQHKRQGKTEGRRRVDFLFPGERAYQDKNFPARKLAMLAAKATCKDRWRQVLDEADRIPIKHLCTLQPRISTDQTRTMHDRGIVLVIPKAIQATYTCEQMQDIMSVEEFLDMIETREMAS